MNKEELIDALGAPCPVSVFGKEDLNDLLFRHADVERRHFKLWIGSSNVLVGLLNNAINGRSDAVMRDIVERSKIFAHTRNFDWGLDKLEQLGTVIITGEPGIGKTTLAEQLILFHAGSGYDLVCISQHIHEAEQAWAPGKCQIFYFDDFLGRNYLEALSGHEGSQVVNFIKRVGWDRSKKKFILTSRSTILNQGRILNDAFDLNNIDKNEMEIKLDSLSALDKAKILYNHIWHSGLTTEHIDSFYVDKRYHDVISHPNFNPRIIQFITDPRRLSEIPADSYWQYMNELLRNPARVWEHPFDAQLDDFGRLLVLLVAFNRDHTAEEHLSIAYARSIALPHHANFIGKREFQVAVRHVSNSLLTRTVFDNFVSYQLFNPSLGDFIIRRYCREPAVLENISMCLRSTTCLHVLADMRRNELITHKTERSIYEKIYDFEKQIDFDDIDPDYLAQLFLAAHSKSPLTDIEALLLEELGGDTCAQSNRPDHLYLIELERAARIILNELPPITYDACIRLLLEAISLNVIQAVETESYVLKVLDLEVYFEEIKTLAELTKLLENDEILSAQKGFFNLAVTHLYNCLFDYIEESDIFIDGYSIKPATAKLRSHIRILLQEWGVSPTNKMIEEIIEGQNLEDRMLQYFSDGDQYQASESTSGEYNVVDIDDLFHKEH